MIIRAWGRRRPGCAAPGRSCLPTSGSSTCTAGRLPARGGGFLGKTCDPFRILQDPNRPDFRIQALTPPRELPLDRLAGRRGLLEQLQRDSDRVLGRRTMDAHQQRAINMILAPATRTAFDLNAE